MDDVKDKIAKLMAMANDGRGNEFEAEAALRLAQKLMLKHGIDAAELQERTGQKPVYNWRSVSVPAGSPKPVDRAPAWYGSLAVGIAIFTDCKAAWKIVPGYGTCIKFSGDSVDVEYAVWLAKHLRDNINSAGARFGAGMAQKNSFRHGMAARLCERMKEYRAQAQTELKAQQVAGGTALALFDNKIALRNAEFGTPRYGTTRRGCSNTSGRDAGRAAGNNVHFGRPVTGGSQARITG